MSRLPAWALLFAAAAAVVAGCGFGVADDTGQPVPAGYWRWVCPDGGAPAPDAGCKAQIDAREAGSARQTDGAGERQP